MSDEKLRELERRFRETGSAEDEAAWLRERARCEPEVSYQIGLASWCGHSVALIATGAKPGPLVPFFECLSSLARFRPEALALASVVACQFVLATWTSEQGDWGLENSLRLCEEAVLDPLVRSVALAEMETIVPSALLYVDSSSDEAGRAREVLLEGLTLYRNLFSGRPLALERLGLAVDQLRTQAGLGEALRFSVLSKLCPLLGSAALDPPAGGARDSGR